jgi:hypothetical protein
MSTILLDFDGVVINNPKINEYITHKSIKFIQKKYNKSYAKAKVINKQLQAEHPRLQRVCVLKYGLQSYTKYDDRI